MQQEWMNRVVQDALHYGIAVNEKQREQLNSYANMLVEWNENVNLTSIIDDEGIAIKHFVDSFTAVPYLKPHTQIIDVGTGAGFPGIPFAIVRPDVHVVLLDSLDKRVKFLQEVLKKLDMKNIHAYHSRAEDFAKQLQWRERFDVSVARAVANLPVLIEYCLPFVKVGGVFIAMKGQDAEKEIQSSQKALQVLGGKVVKEDHFQLPGTDMERTLIIIEKIVKTPKNYPRKSGKPSKDPMI